MAEGDSTPAYLLAIDIGTSTVKVALFEKGTLRTLSVRDPDRDRKADDVSTRKAHVTGTSASQLQTCEQSAREIFSSVEKCISALDREKLSRVVSVGVCGQMHGCILWKSEESFWRGGSLHVSTEEECCSSLITWEDGRCNQDFLDTLPRINGKTPVSSGHGCATLAWLWKHEREMVKRFDRAGTIMDMLVHVLTGGGSGGKVLMSAQNAQSWGYFDCQSLEWEKPILECGFPGSLLPAVTRAPHKAGALTVDWHGIPPGTPVGVAMGDLQCSIYATKPDATDAVFNTGTAYQLAVIKPDCTNAEPSSSDKPLDLTQFPAVTEYPYFNCKTLWVAASLGGGNVTAAFVSMLRKWMVALGVETGELTDTHIYDRLIELALSKPESSLEVNPMLWGERHAPNERGTIKNITADNFTLADVSSAMFAGIVRILRQMMPDRVLRHCKVKRIIGCGKALEINRALQEQIKRSFKNLSLELDVRKGEDALLGAAIAVQSLSLGAAIAVQSLSQS